MRGVLILVLVGGTAYADPEIVAPAMNTHQHPDETSSMFVDFGGGMTRFAEGRLTIHSNTATFAPLATFHHNLYVGPEFYVGSIDQHSTSEVATMDGTQASTTHVTGNLLGVKLVLGARARFGAFLSGAVELAGGFRFTSIRNDNVDLVISGQADRVDVEDTNGSVELRGRVDGWVSPHFSLGVVAGKDLTDTSTMTISLRLGVHFERYDHSL